jgi:hypothetical protein
MMNKQIKQLISLVLGIGLCASMYMGVAHAQAQLSPAFDPAKDGLVSDFTDKQMFGGKYGSATHLVSYTVFIPTGFGFNIQTDILELKYSTQPEVSYKVGAQNGNGSSTNCSTVAGGYQCVLNWNLDLSKPPAGAYDISFVALDSTTHPEGRIVVPMSSGLGYAASGTIYIEAPLTTPYAEFSGAPSTALLTDKKAQSTLSIGVATNANNNPTSTEFYLDGKLVGTSNSAETVADSAYLGGNKKVFSYVLRDLENLANGNHSLTAKFKGADYPLTPVLTDSGQSRILLVAAYTDNQDCSDTLKPITSLQKQLIGDKSDQQDMVGKIDDKVRSYFVKHPSSYKDYKALIAQADMTKKAAADAVASLGSNTSLTCGDYSERVASFLQNIDESHAALLRYK